MNIPKIGTKVEIKIDPIVGVITRIQSTDEGEIQGLLEWTTSDGEVHSRWFPIESLSLTTEEEVK